MGRTELRLDGTESGLEGEGQGLLLALLARPLTGDAIAGGYRRGVRR